MTAYPDSVDGCHDEIRRLRAQLAGHHVQYTHAPGANCPVCRQRLTLDEDTVADLARHFGGPPPPPGPATARADAVAVDVTAAKAIRAAVTRREDPN